MERLTGYYHGNIPWLIGFPNSIQNRSSQNAIRKLAKYEDTELEPEEIVKLKEERDAAIQDLTELMIKLRGTSYCERDSLCVTENCWVRGDMKGPCKPTWRGPQAKEIE